MSIEISTTAALDALVFAAVTRITYQPDHPHADAIRRIVQAMDESLELWGHAHSDDVAALAALLAT